MGRPLLPLDPEQVYKLARIGCTAEEIADILGCNRQTIINRFSDEMARARACLHSSLRRAQYKRAVKDRSDTMLIHLGKNMLGQSDKHQMEVKGGAIFESINDGRDPDLPPPGETT